MRRKMIKHMTPEERRAYNNELAKLRRARWQKFDTETYNRHLAEDRVRHSAFISRMTTEERLARSRAGNAQVRAKRYEREVATLLALPTSQERAKLLERRREQIARYWAIHHECRKEYYRLRNERLEAAKSNE